ncbi:hypothetical protein Swoo_1363 [Shewanella woodyi ATCC 51908]|uniref:Uncharacterized protein n=1 Tax=Shewanella woodyi (strain ATCC 51908 / MS32) TaxID=392500 RepID=B1KJ07_SHEWM|nr:hypothetical protein Swoo_1363 [Shewanella woodyi ATCC 51908]
MGSNATTNRADTLTITVCTVVEALATERFTAVISDDIEDILFTFSMLLFIILRVNLDNG